jgi:hypothetical protein
VAEAPSTAASCLSGSYDARRRGAGRFAGVTSAAGVLAGALANAFRSRLAFSVAIRSVVAGRASTSGPERGRREASRESIEAQAGGDQPACWRPLLAVSVG